MPPGGQAVIAGRKPTESEEDYERDGPGNFVSAEAWLGVGPQLALPGDIRLNEIAALDQSR